MVLLYMVTWIPSIYPLYVSINIPAPWILWVLHLWDVHVSISALDVDNVDKVCTELHCGVLKLLVCGDDDLRWQLALVSTCQHLSAQLKTPSSKLQDLRKKSGDFCWSNPHCFMITSLYVRLPSPLIVASIFPQHPYGCCSHQPVGNL